MRLSLAAAAAGLALAGGAQASTIFSQDFSAGLGAAEQMGGHFQVAGGQGGHVDNGYGNYDYSYYDIALDLTHVVDAAFQFDYGLFAEPRFDGFNVLASTDGSFDWRTDRLTPLSGGAYVAMSNNLPHLGQYAITGDGHDTLAFNLTPFAGQAVKLRLQFESDYSVIGRGLLFDNVQVTGTYAPGYEPQPGVPEPATWALMIAGFFGAGAAVRRRRAALCAA